MEVLLRQGLVLANEAGAEFAELRAVELNEKSISIIDGAVAGLSSSNTAGISVRVLLGGRWGFASGPAGGKAIIKSLVSKAVTAAASAPRAVQPVRLSACFPLQGTWEGPCQQDPFAMPDAELVDLLTAADEAMAVEGVSHRSSALSFRREQKLYINSEGTMTSQRATYSSGGITAWSQGEGEVQHRSWPCFGGSYAGGGFEYIQELDLPGNARRLAEEVLELVKSPACPKGTTDLVLLGSMLAMQIHHTCGIAAELNIPPGIPPEKIGSYRIGSPLLSLVADATLPGGPGSFGFDDEGIKAQSFNIVRDGKFVNFLSGREQAASIGRFSTGAMRASSWLHPPAPSMTNIIIQPGGSSLEDIVGGIDIGILVDSWRNFSVDPDRRGFVAQAEVGWLIEKGKVKHMVRNPVYSGCSTEFLAGCDAVAASRYQKIFGFADISPTRAIVGHGVVPIRVRAVKVGAF